MASITQQPANVELTGAWHESKKSLASRQQTLRAASTSPTSDGQDDGVELCFFSTADGEVVQVIPEDDKATLPQLAAID